MLAKGRVHCCCVAAYCTGMLLLHGTVLLISIQMLIVKSTSEANRTPLNFRVLSSRAKQNLGDQRVVLHSLLFPVLFFWTLPPFFLLDWVPSFQSCSVLKLLSGLFSFHLCISPCRAVDATPATALISSFYHEICCPLNILHCF